METLGQSAKAKAQVLSLNLMEIGNKIREVRKNVKMLNQAKDNITLPAGTKSAFKEVKVDHQVVRCGTCEQDCHANCDCGPLD